MSCADTGVESESATAAMMLRMKRSANELDMTWAPEVADREIGYIVCEAASSRCCNAKIDEYPPDQSGGTRHGRGSWCACNALFPRMMAWSLLERYGKDIRCRHGGGAPVRHSIRAP